MNRFLGEPDLAAFAALFGTTVVKATVDDVLREARAQESSARDVPAFDELIAQVRARLATRENDELAGVLNATGVLLHTNLGRAPLAAEALEAAAAIAGGYSNLEFDLSSGAGRATRELRRRSAR